jgi:hypothetical protein
LLAEHSDNQERDPRCYYQRSELLPDSEATEDLQRSFFEAKRKPIFTSDSARNHLISLAVIPILGL